jgi:hypothetical protein
MLGYTLANEGKGSACRSDRFEASQDRVKRSIDRHTLEMGELATPWTEVRVHEYVGLKRAAEPALTLTRTTRKCRHLSVVFRQESDDSVGVAIVDGA